MQEQPQISYHSVSRALNQYWLASDVELRRADVIEVFSGMQCYEFSKVSLVG